MKTNVKITKENVYDVLESILKERKIRYNVTFDESGNFYELYLGSEDGFIQVELPIDSSDEVVTFQFFSAVRNDGSSLFHSFVDTDYIDFNLESHIDELVDRIQDLNRMIGKIEKHINSIKEICDENELDFEEFIMINYDFDN